MTSNDPIFLADLSFVLAREGGLVDNPKDPGGRTNQGITQRVYDRWRGQQGRPIQDVALIAQEELRAIYYTGYYAPLISLASPDLSLLAFDTAVNMGLTRAILWCQACRTAPFPRDAFLWKRKDAYREIVREHPVLREFLAGWYQRLRILRRYLGMPADPQLDQLWRSARSV